MGSENEWPLSVAHVHCWCQKNMNFFYHGAAFSPIVRVHLVLAGNTNNSLFVFSGYFFYLPGPFRFTPP